MAERQEGDDAFDAFVRSSWHTLRQAAYALTGNGADAEDLLQTVLTRTYARWRTVGRDDPVAYVRRALVNAWIDTWRRQRVLREESSDLLPETAAGDDGTGRVEDRADVQVLLASLSPRERAMVVMRHYLDLSEQDVARTLDCSVGTVKSTCSRALHRLRVPTTHGEDR